MALPRVVAMLPGPDPMTGGIRADLGIVAELSAHGWQVETVHVGEVPSTTRLVSREHLRFTRHLIRRYGSLPAGSILLEDQALSNLLFLFNASVRVRRRARIVLVAHHFERVLWRSRARRFVQRLIDGFTTRRADLVITPSRHTRDELLGLGVSPGRIQVIPFGINARPTRVTTFLNEEDGLHLLTVGAVIPRKGLDYLVRALSDLRHYPWRLDIAGDTSHTHHAQLVALATSLGIADRIAFHGWTSDEELEDLMARADLFISPSLEEGFGLAVLEAMDRGLPVIASRAGALTEIVEHEHTGLLVPPADRDALAHALRRMFDDPDLRSRLGGAAAEAVKDRYTWEKVGERVAAAVATL